jgi:multidrug efflux pump
LGLLLIPVFYVSVRRLLGDKLDEVSNSNKSSNQNDPGPAGTAAA